MIFLGKIYKSVLENSSFLGVFLTCWHVVELGGVFLSKIELGA